MWVCPKCSKQIRDGRKICRECGAILKEVEDKAPTDGDCKSDLSGESGPPSATEEKQPSPVQADSWTGMPQEDERDDEESEPEAATGLEWTCRTCGESVPETFTLCWNCGTTTAGSDALDSVEERPDGGETVPPNASFGAQPRTDLATTTLCAKCGSSKIIPDVAVVDQGQGSDGRLKVVVYGNPDALIFKDRHFGTVSARICGDCGYVELRVRNAAELYKSYVESLGR